jgi:hypothetical protein
MSTSTKKAKTVRAPYGGEAQYNVELTLTERILGTVPKNREIYANYIASKAPEPKSDELETVEDLEERGWTGFHTSDSGLFLFDYQIRGFLKESLDSLRECGAVDIKGVRRKIDRFVFVSPRQIPILDASGQQIKKPDGVVERPLRAQTMQGERVSLVRSDNVDAGRIIRFSLLVQWTDVFTEEVLQRTFARGEFLGLGQWRTGSNGRFSTKIESRGQT